MQKINQIHKREDKLIKKEKLYKNIRIGGFALCILYVAAITLMLQDKSIHSSLMKPLIANKYITISIYFSMTLWTLFFGGVAYSAHMKILQIQSIKYYREKIAKLIEDTEKINV